MTTSDLLERLIALEDAPWGDLKGKPLDPRRLSGFLKPYGVGPKLIRSGGDGVCRGYERSDFVDAWTRYLPPEAPLCLSSEEHVTAVTDVTALGNGHQIVMDGNGS